MIFGCRKQTMKTPLKAVKVVMYQLSHISNLLTRYKQPTYLNLHGFAVSYM